jgi:hypothetical protein
MISAAEIGAWLGSPVEETLSVSRHLSEVHVLRLADARTVVVKARPAHPRLTGWPRETCRP